MNRKKSEQVAGDRIHKYESFNIEWAIFVDTIAMYIIISGR